MAAHPRQSGDGLDAPVPWTAASSERVARVEPDLVGVYRELLGVVEGSAKAERLVPGRPIGELEIELTAVSTPTGGGLELVINEQPAQRAGRAI